jgi:MYXO-CTERM domain-containing protein
MPIRRERLAGSLLLVTVAVAGLLSMHGLEGAVVSLTGSTHATHGPAADSGDTPGLDVCVFVAVLAGLGIGALGAVRRREATVRRAAFDEIGIAPSVSALPGRSRLLQMCVLRL